MDLINLFLVAFTAKAIKGLGKVENIFIEG